MTITKDRLIIKDLLKTIKDLSSELPEERAEIIQKSLKEYCRYNEITTKLKHRKEKTR